MPEPDVYRFEASAHPPSLALVRMFVATTARVLGVDEEVVEDLKLAVSELFSVVIAAEAARTIIVEVTAAETTSIKLTPVVRAETDDDLDPIAVALTLFPTILFDQNESSAVIEITPMKSL